MTTPRPESGTPPATGDRGWNGQAPGWSDWYTGPAYDDTGWFLDLSGVDWGDQQANDEDNWSEQPPEPATDWRLRAQRHDPSGPAAGRDATFSRPGSFREGNGRPSARGISPRDETRATRRSPPLPPRDYSGPPSGSAEGRGRHARSEPTRPVAADAGYLDAGQAGARARYPGVDWRYRDRRPVVPAESDYAPPPLRQPAGRPPAGPPPGRTAPFPGGARLAGPGPGGPLPSGAVPGSAGRNAAGAAAGTAAAGSAQAALVRSSGVMAAGTLGSRLTGFLRTIVQNFALGAFLLGSAYNLSNTLPNVVYNLALGGILTSVIVPLIVNASRRDYDRGAGYDQRMFTLITVALAGITVVAMAAVVPIVGLYSGSAIKGSTEHLAVIWALFFIPQIFFYGVSSLIAAILNSRGSFAAPMWTPIVNNLVVIGVLGLYVATAGVKKQPWTISGGDVTLLGLGTTLGIVAQTLALLPALRRVGFQWHPRLDFRRGEVTEIGRMAGWMFGYIAATQVAFLVTTKLAGDTKTGVSDYSYAWLLFQLPYAVVGISVITALLPRMSAHASERRYGLVRSDFSTGVRLASAIVVPCSLVLAVLGPSLGKVFFSHGATDAAEAHYVGVVFAVFCLGLTPYMVFQLQLRVFYSLHDSRTPAIIGLVTMVVNIVTNLLALNMLPRSELVAGLGAGFGLANLVGTVIAWRILAIRLRGLDGWRIGRSLVRMHAATLPSALLAIVVGMLSGSALVTVVIGGGLALLMYVLFARSLRIDELSQLSRAMLGRFAR
jgi:putative peptidoglycan lipid II flippase